MEIMLFNDGRGLFSMLKPSLSFTFCLYQEAKTKSKMQQYGKFLHPTATPRLVTQPEVVTSTTSDAVRQKTQHAAAPHPYFRGCLSAIITS